MFSYNETSKNADKNIWIGLDLTAEFDNKNYYDVTICTDGNLMV